MSAVGAFRRYGELDDERTKHATGCYRCVRMITDCKVYDRLAEAADAAWQDYMDAALPDWTTYDEFEEPEDA